MTQTQPVRTVAAVSSPDGPSTSRAYFQYTGKTAMTVIGGVTGEKYRFPNSGATVAVDARDRRSISAVPGLRRVAGP